jgi:hypothetical protein
MTLYNEIKLVQGSNINWVKVNNLMNPLWNYKGNVDPIGEDIDDIFTKHHYYAMNGGVSAPFTFEIYLQNLRQNELKALYIDLLNLKQKHKLNEIKLVNLNKNFPKSVPWFYIIKDKNDLEEKLLILQSKGYQYGNENTSYSDFIDVYSSEDLNALTNVYSIKRFFQQKENDIIYYGCSERLLTDNRYIQIK